MCPADFGKQRRLLNSKQFSAVFEATELRSSSKELLILAKKNQLGHARLGFVIAKKHVKLAVDRNRIKRVIRESFLLQQDQLDALDFVVLARSSVLSLSASELRLRMDHRWSKLKHVKPRR